MSNLTLGCWLGMPMILQAALLQQEGVAAAAALQQGGQPPQGSSEFYLRLGLLESECN